jgi:nickel superoxide dismutase
MKKQIRKKLGLVGFVILACVFATIAYSHCQIPCGIYDDHVRFDMISEHITTIEKSMKMITELSKQEKANMNQIVRWVQNKEKHADEISHIVTHYFMAQRVKPSPKTEGKEYDEYVKKLTLLHKMLISSMKAKQTIDLVNVERLRSLLAEFHLIYFGEAEHSRHK